MSQRPEIETTLMLSHPRLAEADRPRLRALLHQAMDWYRVLGLLAAHRTAGIAWTSVLDHAIDERRHVKPSYFLKGLEIIYKGQSLMAQEQLEFTAQLQRDLDARGIPSALLKGAAVASMGYRRLGMRQFNDNDLLIDHENLAAATAAFKELDYVQGSWDYPTSSIRPVPRKQMLFFAVTSHQTYPYMKATPGAHTLECHRVDVHFSVDLMTSNRTDDLVRDLLRRRIQVGSPPVWTLPALDMLIFCCVHFYKEAIYHGEVLQLKDLVLYKLTDVMVLLDEQVRAALPDRARQLGLEQAVYYTLHALDTLYPGYMPSSLLDEVRPTSVEYLDEIRDGGGPVHRWRAPLIERFFDAHRVRELPDLGNAHD